MNALMSLTSLGQKRSPEATAFARDLIEGLSRTPRSIAPKYFYDAEGSALFDRITRTPEYYPTRIEKRILSDYAHDIAAIIGSDADIVELGAGSQEKVRILLDAAADDLAWLRYVPVDISRDHLAEAAVRLQAIYPELEILPVVADFTGPFSLPSSRRKVGFFPGSTLGIFDYHEAKSLLRRFCKALRGGGLLLGIDLVKDPAILHEAYNDAGGATAAFNLNLLRRANREVGVDFNLEAFRHYACYQPSLQRVEMHLVSSRRQTVTIDQHRFEFAEGDSIHTESSYKYNLDGVLDLATAAGFQPAVSWTDPDKHFSVHWLEAR